MKLANLIKGGSSLVFIISSIHAFLRSRLILWKLSNVSLIVASFVCNATDYNPVFLQLDYLAIYFLCVSYINNRYINIPYGLFLIYAYTKTKSFENAKNIAALTSLGKTIIYTYLYVDRTHFGVVIASSISGIGLYIIRYYQLRKKNTKYQLLFTYLFHLLMMNILYVSSITAN